MLDMLKERGLRQNWLAKEMGRPIKTINEIVKGKCAITPETALQLEKIFKGVDAEFWCKRESDYRLSLLRTMKTARAQKEK